jgi:hypothetical protein
MKSSLVPWVVVLLASTVGQSAEPAQLNDAENKQGFRVLFDGVSFTGWEQKGNWRIEDDGSMHRFRSGGDVSYAAAKVPDDFELRFDWKASKGCNSGVYYRPTQYEYQVLDDVFSPYGENPRQAAASLFFCMAPSKRLAKPHDEWNTARIVCQGTVIQHWLNDEAVIDFDYADPKWRKEVGILKIRGGNLAARGGTLRLQDHGQDVWFRYLRWRTIPTDEKLTRYPFTPLPVEGTALEKENARIESMLKAKRDK